MSDVTIQREFMNDSPIGDDMYIGAVLDKEITIKCVDPTYLFLSVTRLRNNVIYQKAGLERKDLERIGGSRSGDFPSFKDEKLFKLAILLIKEMSKL